MKILTIEETEEWLTERRFGFRRAPVRGSDHALILRTDDVVKEFTIPSNPREQLVLAHRLGRWFKCSGALLVETVVTGFTDAEIDLFLDFRRYFGDERSADDAPGGGSPGRIFDDSDKENRRTVTEYMYLLMAFNFEGYFVETDGLSVIWSGDEVMEIHTRDQARAHELHRTLEDLGIQLFESPS